MLHVPAHYEYQVLNELHLIQNLGREKFISRNQRQIWLALHISCFVKISCPGNFCDLFWIYSAI